MNNRRKTLKLKDVLYFSSQLSPVTPPIDITPVKDFSMGVRHQFTQCCVGKLPRTPWGRDELLHRCCHAPAILGLEYHICFLKLTARFGKWIFSIVELSRSPDKCFPGGRLICAHFSELVAISPSSLYSPWPDIYCFSPTCGN